MPVRWPRRRLEPELAPEDRAMLANIQGNIVRPHGRDRAMLVFFSFGANVAANRANLARTTELITSAEQQRLDGRAFRVARVRGTPPPECVFFSLALSATGLAACDLAGDPPPGADRAAEAFAQGMAADHRILGDPPADVWDEPFSSGVDGVWLVAGATNALLHEGLGRVHGWLQRCGGRLRAVEQCFHWRPEPHKRWACREPFGFADGISNPEFFEGRPANHWSINLGLDRVLIEDPESLHHGGSFLVLRKLEQNVAAFRAFEAKLAAHLRASLPPDRQDEANRLAEAAIIGRDRDGIPLADLEGRGLNTFSFAADARALRCPFHAHIRKANPRDDNPYAPAIAPEDARRFQFVRRSMVYGDSAKLTLHGPDWPTGGVGLWFIGYMRDIEEQFREMQGRWMRDRHFPGHNRDALPDPLLFGGMSDGGRPADTWHWSRGEHTFQVPGLAQFVRPRGGEYLYVPSLRWLAAGGVAS